MVRNHTEGRESKESFYENLEEIAQGYIQRFLQDLLEQEAKELLGRPRYQRKAIPKRNRGLATGTASHADSP